MSMDDCPIIGSYAATPGGRGGVRLLQLLGSRPVCAESVWCWQGEGKRDRRRFGGERWEPTQPFSFNEIRARRGKLNWERNHTRLRPDLRRLHWRVNLRLYGGGFGSGGRGGGSGDNNYGNSSSISVGGGSYGNLQQHQSSTKAAAAATSTTTLLLSTRSAFIETNTKID